MPKDMSITNLVIIALAAVIFLSFFLPWAHVEAQAIGKISKVLTGKEQAVIDSISGFKVPIMVNSPDARLAISVIKIFAPKVTNADKKSFLIWVVPLLAVAMAGLAFFMGQDKRVNLAIGIAGVLIFIAGTYKVMTTDLNKLVLNIRIGAGLWLTFWAYLGIGLAALVNFLQLNKKA